MYRQTGLVVIFSALVLLAGGCGSGAPYPLARVHGKVQYSDGTLIPAKRLIVRFVPQVAPVNPKEGPRAGTAEVNPADGTFDSASTYSPGDGVIIGKQKVVVIAMGDSKQPTTVVPENYTLPNATPLEVEVTSSGLDKDVLQIPKPAAKPPAKR